MFRRQLVEGGGWVAVAQQLAQMAINVAYKTKETVIQIVTAARDFIVNKGWYSTKT